MRIVIHAGEDDEVFATLRDIQHLKSDRFAGTDDEGNAGVTVESVLREAVDFELEELARPHERENR